MKSVISNHSRGILEEGVATGEGPCGCRGASNCPVNGRCGVRSIVYTAAVTPRGPPPPSAAAGISVKQPANNVTPQQLLQTAANATNTTRSRKEKAAGEGS